MRSFLLATLILAALPVYSTFQLDQLPPCVKKACVDTSVVLTCPNTDTACYCNNEDFMTNAVNCARTSCSVDDFDTARSVALMLCAASGAGASSSVIQAPLTSSTPSVASNTAHTNTINRAQIYVSMILSALIELALFAS